MNEFRRNIDGKEFLIINKDGQMVFYRLLNGEQKLATDEEMRLIKTELDKIKNNSIENYKITIAQMIANSEIKTLEELKAFIDTLDPSIRNELYEFGQGKINSQNEKTVEYTPVETLYNELFNNISEAKNFDKKVQLSFKVVNGVAGNYVEVSLSTKKDDIIINFPKQYTKYDPETFEMLICPLLSLVNENEETLQNDYKKVENDFSSMNVDYRSVTEKGNSCEVKNIAGSSAEELKKLVEEKKYSRQNPGEPRVLKPLDPKSAGKINIYIVLTVIVLIIFFIYLFLKNYN